MKGTASMNELALQQNLTMEQRMLFQSEMNRVRKDPTVALLLCLLLGGIGAHHFYMGNIGTGVLYLLFFWTFIPAFIALVELFLITRRVRDYNDQKAAEVYNQIRVLATSFAPISRTLSAPVYCTGCGAKMDPASRCCSGCGKPSAS
jgi:TM2 domain-containing membrane protein YozV